MPVSPEVPRRGGCRRRRLDWQAALTSRSGVLVSSTCSGGSSIGRGAPTLERPPVARWHHPLRVVEPLETAGATWHRAGTGTRPCRTVASPPYVAPLHRTRIGRHPVKFSSSMSGRLKNTSIHDALVELLGKPIGRLERPVHPHRAVRASLGRPWHQGVAVHQRKLPRIPWLTWAGSPSACWSCTAAAQHRSKSAGCPWFGGDGRPARGRAATSLPAPLDAAVGAGGPASVPDRDGLGGTERPGSMVI